MKIMPVMDSTHGQAGAGSRPDRQDGTRGDGRTAARRRAPALWDGHAGQRIAAALVAGHDDKDSVSRIVTR